jgi:zinc protease
VLRAYLVPARRTAVSINPAASDPAGARSSPPPGGKGGRSTGRFSETRLANGARLLLRRDPRLPNLHLRLLMGGGPLFEEPGLRGSTALLATMLTKDTRRRSAAEVAGYVEEVGGSFYPFSGNNSLGLGAEVLAPDAGRALSVMGDAILSPAFREGTFAIERDAQLASLQEDDDDVVTHSRKLLRRNFFGSHPLALDAQGDAAGVRALTPGHLAALHRKLSAATNVVLAVSGDFDPARLAPKLTAFLSRLSPDGAAAASSFDSERLPEAPGDSVEIQEREQAVVLQAYPSPRNHAPDHYAGEVADELFSGMASRLFERVRDEKGLAYFIRSERVIGLDAGMFCFLAGTQPGREAEVQAEIEAEIGRVQSGAVEEAELRRCRERLKAAWRQQSQTNSARTLRAGLDALQGRPANDGDQYDARIDAVTGSDVQAFARRYFQPQKRVRLVVRPAPKP